VADVDQGGSRRPVLLWVCLAYLGLVALFTGLGLALIVGRVPVGKLPILAAGYKFWNKPWFIVDVISGTAAAITVVQLFKYKRSAVYFANALFLAAIAGTFGLVPGGRRLDYHAASNWWSTALNLSALVYVWHLFRKGVLK
jgi:hypothetical protein